MSNKNEFINILINYKLKNIKEYQKLLNKAITDQDIKKINHYSKLIYDNSNFIDELNLFKI